MLKLVYWFYRVLFARRSFYKLNRLLYTLSLRGIGILNFESDFASGEDFFIKSYVANIGKGVILDVGANVGNYSLKIREINQNVDIFCFEPHPINFNNLKNNLMESNVKFFNFGVGSLACNLNLYDYANNDGSSHASVYKEVIEGIHNQKATEYLVEVITLDEFVNKYQIENVHLLKIDTEGHEFNVLKGFENHIRAGKVNIIHFEFNEMNVASRAFFKDFWDFLPNYEFYRMLPDGLVPIKEYSPIFCEIFAYQNIVAKLKIDTQLS